MATLDDCESLSTLEVIDPSLVVTVTPVAAYLEMPGGVKIPALTATWSAIASPYITGIQFEYGPSDLSSGIIRKSAGKEALAWSSTDGVVAARSYAFRYRAVGVGIQTYGPWVGPTTIVAGAAMVADTVVDQGGLATLDETDTPQISPNAVTNYVSAETSTVQTLTGTTPKTVQTVSYDTTGEKLEIRANFFMTIWHPSPGDISANLRILRTPGGLVFDRWYTAINGDLLQGWQSPMVLESPAAGSYTYDVIVTLSNNGAATMTVDSSVLIVEETKR